MSDFTELVRRINQIGGELPSDKSEVITESSNPYKQTADEAVAGARETASLLHVISDIEGKKVQEAEEVESDIRSRFSDFMKSEVAQGNDLSSVKSAVEEGTSSAMAVDDSFQKMYNMMSRLLKITSEAGVLSKMVEREGGDSAWIADANKKLTEAMDAIEEAHMYSQPPQDVDGD